MNTRYLVPSRPPILLCISPRSLCPPILSGFKVICGKVFSGRIEITYFSRFGKTVAFISETG